MESLTQLYTELRTPIFRYLQHMGCDRSTAEELTQESFLQALRALPRFRGESTVRTWLFGIARNQYLKRLRWEQRHGVALTTDSLETVADGGPDPAEAATARELEAWLWAALTDLPEESRTALLLREYEGLSYNEVAAVLGRSTIWCRVTCFRAKERLRNHYLAQAGGPNHVD